MPYLTSSESQEPDGVGTGIFCEPVTWSEHSLYRTPQAILAALKGNAQPISQFKGAKMSIAKPRSIPPPSPIRHGAILLFLLLV